MAEGRTIWWAKDASWWERERTVILGEQHGPAGPAILDWLCSQAKKQNDGGRVRAGFRAVARGTFTTDQVAREVIATAVEFGALDDYKDEGITFSCAISGWRSDQETFNGAERQRRYRERLRSDGTPTGASGPTRKRVMDRDGNQCLKCGAVEDLVVDHVVPKSKGGGSDETNLQTLCDKCNRDKGTSDHDYRPNATSRVTPGDGVTSPETPCPTTEQDRTISIERAKALSPEEKASEDDKRLCVLLRTLASERNPKFKVKSRERWLTDMRLLRERDGNEPAEIERAIRWVFTDDFWGSTIQSPANLREHFAKVWAKMNVTPKPGGKPESVDSFLARRGAA